MLTNPACPVCGATEWTVVGERTYRRPASLDGKQQKPLRVLFDVWAPGEQEFRVRFAGCKRCAMMIYLPRPGPADLEAKYRALAQYGDATPSLGEAPRRTRLRSKRLFDLMTPRLGRPVDRSRILDFGGGDGRLLLTFAEAGAACDVVDYCEEMIPGVRHVGRTVDALAGEPSYDAIICSHVVEHLAEPLPVLRQLVGNLAPDGVIYVEVPVEMVKRMPAGTEPVTHCNFFIPESLAALMERAGCRLISCKLTAYPHPNGSWMLCAGALATPGAAPASATGAGLPALRRYLDPPLPFLIRLRTIVWRSLPRLATRKLLGKARSLMPARAAARP
ncbi:MAG TPA: class I SAM-dependent methyltransferase [Allosphingosinicella sp.]|nr:class I SAM-dependent methyltransferase [Allosphingosinicella sp.]